MNLQMAVLDVRRMIEADRLAVAAGVPPTEQMKMPVTQSPWKSNGAGPLARSPCSVDPATTAVTVSPPPGT
jgi:hypothetical protein